MSRMKLILNFIFQLFILIVYVDCLLTIIKLNLNSNSKFQPNSILNYLQLN